MYRWIEEDAYVISIDSIANRVVGVMKDITEQRRVQDLINESEKKLRAVFNASKDCIIILDRNFKIQDANYSTLYKSAYLRDELLGMNIAELFNSPIQSELLERVEFNINQCFMGNFETNLKVKNNGNLPVEISATTLD